MTTPAANEGRIDYIEFHAGDISVVKAFYTDVFRWKFTDYGPDYTSFEDGRITGGFTKDSGPAGGSPLVVVYSAALEATEERIKKAGGKITQAIFSFPGGRRFHFADPGGNILAVWSDK